MLGRVAQGKEGLGCGEDLLQALLGIFRVDDIANRFDQRFHPGVLLQAPHGTRGVLVFQAGITYLPFFNGVFQTAPIGWDGWLRIFAAGFAALLLVETQKALIGR